MAFTHTLTQQFASGSSSISHAVALTGGLESNLDEAIPENSTDLEVVFALDYSALRSFYMVSDVAMMVKTNVGTDDTFTLVANQPMAWYLGCGLTNPFTADVATNIFVTNTTVGTLRIRAITDPTP